jgi:flagellar hook assembly protein FlgD
MLVRYALPTQSQTSLRIYNAEGVLVRTLTAAVLPAGFHSALWNGTDDRGQRVQPGTYFCRFQTPGFTRIAKLIMTD